tara:strand:- start:469 stop:720 length:252 start_codon:yes stop_codon:yes gene_type:complete
MIKLKTLDPPPLLLSDARIWVRDNIPQDMGIDFVNGNLSVRRYAQVLGEEVLAWAPDHDTVDFRQAVGPDFSAEDYMRKMARR